jgi:hypothetical protein
MDTESHELIAGYALDALDETDRRKAEELLAMSAEAREELRSFVEVSAAMAMAAGPTEGPSPELRERIVAEARAEPQVVVPFERPATRRARLVPVLAVVSAVAATVAIGLGIWAASLSNDLDSTRAALAHEQSIGNVLADPSARTVGLDKTSGRLVVDGAGSAVLIVDDIELAPQGKTYEAWIIDDGVAKPAGLFPGGPGQSVVRLEHPVSTGSLVAVTVEDAAGAAQPTGTPIVTSSPV